jgi:hypothetical protein
VTAPGPGHQRQNAQPDRSALDDLGRAHADPRLTLANIGRWRLARLSARDLVHDDRRGALWFRVGPSRPHRVVLVVLRGDDTYAVEVGRLVRVRYLPVWVSEAAVGVDQGLYAGQLGEQLDALIEQVTG